MKKAEDWESGYLIYDRDIDTVEFEFAYPTQNRVKYLEVGLCCVRASDSIRISYSHKRNGWVVEQASIFEWDSDDNIQDPDWQEVAFIESWGRERK